MFSTGRIIFVIVFVFVFVGGLIWSYRKDKEVSDIHFRKAYKILIALLLFIILQFIIVKMKSIF
jgi:hypothetical protein